MAHRSLVTADDYYRLCADAPGTGPVLVHILRDWLLPLEMAAIPDDLLSELTQFHVAFPVDKFRCYSPEFCWVKALPQAAADYVAYHDRKGDIPPTEDRYGDRLVRARAEARGHYAP